MEYNQSCIRNSAFSRRRVDGEANTNTAPAENVDCGNENRSVLGEPCGSRASRKDRLGLSIDLKRQHEEDNAWIPESTTAFASAVHPVHLGRRCTIDNDFGGWQSQFPTLKSRVAHLFNNELMSDVLFIVGRQPMQQRFYAHKFVLAIGSSVFHVMFFGTMAEHQRYNKSIAGELEAAASTSSSSFELMEATTPVTGNRVQNSVPFVSTSVRAGMEEIEIDDVEPTAFETLLRLLYTDNAEITPHFVMSTLYLAKKYSVPALERLCIDFLQTNLTPDNAFLLLTQARLFDEQQLVDKCLDSIDQQTVESLDTDYFMDINLDTLCIVLERDSLQVRESKLFSAVVQWAQHECMRQHLPTTGENQRRVLGRAIHMLRFPIMTLEEFANGPAQSGVLTDAELVKLFLHFTVNPKPDVPFLDVPRNCYTGKEHVVSRFQRTDRRWGYTNTADCIRISLSRPVFVVGFGLYGSAMNSADYAVTMEIVEISKQRKLAEHKTNFTSDGSQAPHRVLFPKPVGLQADQQYLLSVLMKGPDSFYGSGGQSSIYQDCGKEGVVKINFSYSHGNNNGTSVEDGQIPEIIFYLCGPNSFSAPIIDGSQCSKRNAALDEKPSNNVNNAGILAASSLFAHKGNASGGSSNHTGRTFANNWNNNASNSFSGTSSG